MLFTKPNMMAGTAFARRRPSLEIQISAQKRVRAVEVLSSSDWQSIGIEKASPFADVGHDRAPTVIRPAYAL